MATNRSYHDNCGMAHALDLVGERWSLLVVRELLFGAKRFGDLKRDLPGISTNMLTDRLAELERDGVVTRRQLPPPAAARVYELTQWGAQLEPAIQAIGRWGASSPRLPTDQYVSATSIIMSLRTNFDAGLAAGLVSRVALVMGDDSFVIDIADGVLTTDRGTPRADDVAVEAAPAVLAGLLYGGLDPADAVADGPAVITGDVDAVRAFLGVFHLPQPATV